MSEELAVTRDSSRPVAILPTRGVSVAHARVPADDAAGSLRRLLNVCQDSAHGLKNAARASTMTCFRSLLMTAARHRNEIARELGDALLDLEDDAGDHSGPIATGARGLWSDAVNAEDDLARAAVCERAEEATRRAFEDARRRGLPAHVDALVARHVSLINDAIDHLRCVRQH